MRVYRVLHQLGHRRYSGMEQITGPWFRGVEPSTALLMKREPEPHLPHTHTHTHTLFLSSSSTQCTVIKLAVSRIFHGTFQWNWHCGAQIRDASVKSHHPSSVTQSCIAHFTAAGVLKTYVSSGVLWSQLTTDNENPVYYHNWSWIV